ncbi:TNFAIP3-interacting protein 2-like [Lingula anatina]|uniref:TNFAIP3-interacting protein 2-like n=1 Tax=Lingula anatina TaxID=7574 RepID=A0A1S3JNN5_LINAN|nr:TNFAIP3-interacting protein 2-like [Lingula anatina]|eukprot:XP_013411579.1 TNFAIP3-interacting protein 2-like [Lingula anatina]
MSKDESLPKPKPRTLQNERGHIDITSLSMEDFIFPDIEENTSPSKDGQVIHSKSDTEEPGYRIEAQEREPELKGSRKDDGQTLDLDLRKSKQQLSETAALCRDLADKLDRGYHKRKQAAKEQSRLVTENERLKQQLKEVIEANLRWQKYNEERENFVKNELKSRKTHNFANGVSGASLTDEQQKEVDKILLNAKAKISSVEEENEKLQDSIRELRLIIHRKDQEIEKLKNAGIRQDRHQSSHDDEYVSILREQIRAVTEDFEAERRDREAAHSKIVELENQLRQLKANCWR